MSCSLWGASDEYRHSCKSESLFFFRWPLPFSHFSISANYQHSFKNYVGYYLVSCKGEQITSNTCADYNIALIWENPSQQRNNKRTQSLNTHSSTAVTWHRLSLSVSRQRSWYRGFALWGDHTCPERSQGDAEDEPHSATLWHRDRLA